MSWCVLIVKPSVVKKTKNKNNKNAGFLSETMLARSFNPMHDEHFVSIDRITALELAIVPVTLTIRTI